ncbi:hypothetical protein CNE_BB1p06590 (plasmid) [Cupriavidus necator N-1]|uniref:Uncharacterized protein n=1 Tax=Cupriavidus necator (strain ATCC 43291 / DSM 13513 / CCUG 52238 / LMG 8453 / N-1) TaxID=1042878 RepID=F8GXK9_CUPNN|nr:hypothetical protein CNE_BB1p06590 [Cupriavidus necator N-1]
MGSFLSTLFSGPVSPKDYLQILKSAFEAWKFLKGKEPKEAIRVDNESIAVTNSTGEVRVFKDCVINIISNEKAGDAVERFVGTALSSDGVNRVSLEDSRGREVTSADSSEADYFHTQTTSNPTYEFENVMALIIEAPTFRDGNKWKFSDGQSTFNALIEDKEFIARVKTGEERFGNGDELVVRLKTQQTISSGGAVKTDKTITEVLEHKIRHQGKLL